MPRFLTGRKSILRLRLSSMRLQAPVVKDITALGMSGFIMSITNSAVQIVCNSSLSRYGGDLYVGVMTIINSIREIVTMPVMGVTNGAQPVIGYNHGAGQYARIKKAIAFMSAVCITYTTVIWGILHLFPTFFIRIFSDEALLRKAVIVIPLTLVLPHLITPSVNGVFAAEPISNLIGGTACFLTMLFLVSREIRSH